MHMALRIRMGMGHMVMVVLMVGHRIGDLHMQDGDFTRDGKR